MPSLDTGDTGYIPNIDPNSMEWDISIILSKFNKTLLDGNIEPFIYKEASKRCNSLLNQICEAIGYIHSNIDRSVELLNQIVSKYPKISELYVLQSCLFLAKQDLQNHINFVQIALHIEPTNLNARIQMLKLLLANNQTDAYNELLLNTYLLYPSNTKICELINKDPL